jgi:signal transduction histidine kinase/HPt (histidine-containing phosphotransfer) domain-containing protein
LSGRNARILIVDDEIHNRKLLELLLHSDGYQTRSATNGEDALASIAQDAPDLILLDIMMPGIDGFQVASILKAAPATASIPIIMVTALIDQASRLAGLNAGVEEFLTKPLERAELLIRVRNLLRLKTLADLLRDHNSVLQQQVRTRTAEFLANMSHEVRTPMSAVVGLADLLGQTSLSEEQADTLGKLKIASHALLSLLNNVLDLSKIEAGELIVESAPFDLRALLQTQGSVFAAQARAKGIAFTIDAADDLPTRLEGDANRLAQILSILLSNAVKFTDHGAVSLRVRQSDVTAKRVTLCFVVTDSGIGITPDVQATLFKPFVQADGSTTRRHGGTGLGLSIVRGLANLMGGAATLSSSPGAGSELTVTLDFDFAPAARASLPPAAGVDRSTGAGALQDLHALVVDDSDINLVLMKRHLEMHGATAELADDGLQAFELLQARPHDFKMVLMDVQMPVLDGYAATQRIRKELRLSDLPIIAVSAGALSSHRRLATEAGMNDYIVKPFDSETLVQTILRHVKPAFDSASAPIGVAPMPMARAQTAVGWPEIEGIVSADVRARLSGDFALFRSLLTRLLDEFSDLAICGKAQDTDALALCRARLHKLKGSAGMLGANAIQALAGEGEAAFASGDFARAVPMATRIAIQLQRLREHALPAFLLGAA